MKVLVADSFEKSGIDGLVAAGCEVVYKPELKDEALALAIRDTAADVLVVRGTAVTGPMLERGSLSLDRPCGRRLQHDRRRDGVQARHLRVELSRQERDCRRRTGVRPAARGRSPGARRGRGSPRRHLEQEGVFKGARAVRPHDRPARIRQHRPGDGPPRPRLRHADRRLEPPVRHRQGRRRQSGGADAAGELARGGGGPLRRAERPPCAQRGHEGAGQRLGAGPVEARLLLHQHRARRSRGLRRARACGSRARHSGRPRRVRGGADDRDRASSRMRSSP